MLAYFLMCFIILDSELISVARIESGYLQRGFAFASVKVRDFFLLCVNFSVGVPQPMKVV